MTQARIEQLSVPRISPRRWRQRTIIEIVTILVLAAFGSALAVEMIDQATALWLGWR